MMNATGILAALGFVALGLTSTAADAHVDVVVAPATVAVGGLVVTVGNPYYAPPPPVVYAPAPTTVVYRRPSYRAPVVYRPVISHHGSCDGYRAHTHAHAYAPQHKGHGHAYGHAKNHGNGHAKGHGHGKSKNVKHRR